MTDEERRRVEAELRQMSRAFCEYIDSLGRNREFSIAKTEIQGGILWAIAGLNSEFGK
jgi:hypothetical protein